MFVQQVVEIVKHLVEALTVLIRGALQFLLHGLLHAD